MGFRTSYYDFTRLWNKKKTGCVYVDREFFNIPYISVLEEFHLTYLMPAKKNKKINRIIKETKNFPTVMPYKMSRYRKTVGFTLVLLNGGCIPSR